MLFRIHSDIATGDKDFFDMNEGARGIERFNMLSSRQMFFVCLVADVDYDSPLRSLPERIRREKAVVIAGYPLEDDKRPDKNGRNLINGKVPNVELAIANYREIQYDEDKAMLYAVDAQIKNALDLISRNKEEACTIEKTNEKSKVTTKYVDMTMVARLTVESMKVASNLPALRKTKAELLEKIKSTSPISEITTYTAQDLQDNTDEDFDPDDESSSTLDKFMLKQKQLKENNEPETE